MAILKRVTPTVAFCLLAAVGRALEERTQVGEAEPSAKGVVLDNLDRRAPEFISELHIMTPGFP